MSSSAQTSRRIQAFTEIFTAYRLNLLKREKKQRRLISAGFIFLITPMILCFCYWPDHIEQIGAFSPPPAMAVDLVVMPATNVSAPQKTAPEPQKPQTNAQSTPQEASPKISVPSAPAPHPAILLKKQNKKPHTEHKNTSSSPKNHAHREAREKPSFTPAISSPSTAPQPVTQSVNSATSSPFHNKTSWQTALLAQLEKFKRYPASAMADSQEGAPIIRFSIDRQGHVLNTKLIKTSGYSLLDEEALSLPQRAQPLPAPPETVKGDIITLTVPVEFTVR